MGGFRWETPNPSAGTAPTPEELKAANDLAASVRPKDADAQQVAQLAADGETPEQIMQYMKGAAPDSDPQKVQQSIVAAGFLPADRVLLKAIAVKLGVEV
jgi:hypothetical protein